MKKMTKRKLIIGLAAYVGLWVLTGVFGEIQIDSRFNGEFSEGTKAGFTEGLKQYPMEKTRRITEFDVSKPDGGLGDQYPELPWKYRSRAIAVAPFVLVDKCAYGTGGLCGWGGIRLHVWFFGLTHWWHAKSYWVS
ncbi:MAG: hypothetical protein JXM70_15015 [Pirellulales bacterium]|nr:hypothetical protein [Pirellulales bacterium]